MMGLLRTAGLLTVIWLPIVAGFLLSEGPDFGRDASHTNDPSAREASRTNESSNRDFAPGSNERSAASTPTADTPARQPSAPVGTDAVAHTGAVPSIYDGPWSEAGCDELANVDDLRERATAQSRKDTLRQLAEARYPPGVMFIDAMDDDAIEVFSDGPSFDALVRSFDTVVHEGSHLWVMKELARGPLTPATMRDRSFALLPNDVRRLEHFPDFSRSRIRPTLPTTNPYQSTYLEGDSGAQGFLNLLNELNAYVHTLAAATCVRDLYRAHGSRSVRDGVLAMLEFVGAYLRLARTDEPAVYAGLQERPEYARFILDQWERAHFWLAKSAPYAHLGLHDREYWNRVHEESIASEFQALRANAPPPSEH